MIKALVAVLGLVIVVLLGFVIWGVIRQATLLQADPQDAAVAVTPSPSSSPTPLPPSALARSPEKTPALEGVVEAELDLPFGCRIEAAEPFGDRYLALRVEGSLAKGCKQILVIDLQTGAPRVRLTLPRKARPAGVN